MKRPKHRSPRRLSVPKNHFMVEEKRIPARWAPSILACHFSDGILTIDFVVEDQDEEKVISSIGIPLEVIHEEPKSNRPPQYRLRYSLSDIIIGDLPQDMEFKAVSMSKGSGVPKVNSVEFVPEGSTFELWAESYPHPRDVNYLYVVVHIHTYKQTEL